MADRTTIDTSIDNELQDRTGNPDKTTGPELNTLMKLLTANYLNTDGLPTGMIIATDPTDSSQGRTSGVSVDADGVTTFEDTSVLSPAVNVGATMLAATGNIVRLIGATGDVFVPAGLPVTAAGTGTPSALSLGAFGPLPAAANQTTTDTTSTLAPGGVMEFGFPVPAGVSHVTSQTDVIVNSAGDVRLEIFDANTSDITKRIVNQRISLGIGTNTVDFDSWPLFVTAREFYTRYTNIGSTSVEIQGTGSGASFRPYNLNRGYSYAVVTLESLMTNVRTLEQFQDAVAAMFTGGTHNGITVDYDDTNGVINLDVTGTTPPVTPSPAVSGFSIDLPATWPTSTSLDITRNIQFTTQGTSQISTLDLVVTTGDDQALIVPSSDGSHTQSVTLSGIETANPATVTFQIRGTTSGGATIMSNTQTLTIRTQTADEFAYYGTSATNNAATIDTATLTSVDVQQPGTSYDINTTLNAGEFLIILEPSDRAITAITELTFNVDALSRFTRTTNVRTINSQQYDTYVLQNNGPSGSVSFRVTHG